MFSKGKNVPEVSGVFPHVDVQVVLPFGDVATLGTHEVLVVGVSEQMFGEVRLVSTPEVTQTTLVGLLAFQRENRGGDGSSFRNTAVKHDNDSPLCISMCLFKPRLCEVT